MYVICLCLPRICNKKLFFFLASIIFAVIILAVVWIMDHDHLVPIYVPAPQLDISKMIMMQ